ncbi:MAG: cupin domain-containing protein [Candidatus Rokubacteria bacterium]|nr:cupin domain-containing protein [Candidatus Rokubacteria bacterium]
MAEFATLRRSEAPTTRAPDGADVRILLGLARGGMAEFELAPGAVSAAVTHRTVEEIWYVLRGRGEMWRRQGSREEVARLEPGLCLTVPLGVLGVTMPPWPGAGEAIAVEGRWPPTLPPS